MKTTFAPLLLLVALLTSFNLIATPVLNSFPSANSTIYLDFDGYTVNSAYWRTSAPFTCAPTMLSEAQISEVFNRVSEDFRPFDINITTDEATYLAAPLSSRIRIVVTPTSDWYQGVSGVSWVGSFTWGDDTPAFVFSDRLLQDPKMIAECCSHESGHTLGLYHQSVYDSTCNLTARYNTGQGSGQTGWAPIMGNGYHRNMTGWSNGATPYGCTSSQDNLSVITSQNGFTYRVDDYTDNVSDSPVTFAAGTTMQGIISTSTDKDAFKFTLVQKSAVHIDVRPFSVDSNFEGSNLDIKLSLYNSAHELVATYDPAATLDALLDTSLGQGDWYMVVDGAGNENTSDYGSLGGYTISSSANAIQPELSVVLTGQDDLDRHVLNWNFSSVADVKLITVESSSDDIHFTPVNTVSGGCKDFIYTPFQKTDIYYRLKAISVGNQTTYSNTILLKSVIKLAKSFMVSTLVQDAISVDAPENYQYIIVDLKGNLLARGKGQAGFNRVSMNGLPPGMYVLQLLSNNQRQTERIFKTVR